MVAAGGATAQFVRRNEALYRLPPLSVRYNCLFVAVRPTPPAVKRDQHALGPSTHVSGYHNIFYDAERPDLSGYMQVPPIRVAQRWMQALIV